MNRKTMQGFKLTAIARTLIMAAAICHLVFASIHVKALLLLENEICGFIMFLFVLSGLVTMFESTRIRVEKLTEKIFTAVMCLVTAGFGYYLTSIYRYALENQRALEPAAVNRAVVFSMALMAVFMAAGVLLMLDFVRTIRIEAMGRQS